MPVTQTGNWYIARGIARLAQCHHLGMRAAPGLRPAPAHNAGAVYNHAANSGVGPSAPKAALAQA